MSVDAVLLPGFRGATRPDYVADRLRARRDRRGGGDVTRLHYVYGSPYPGASLFGRLDDLALTAAVGAAVAGELRGIGIDLNLASVAAFKLRYANYDRTVWENRLDRAL